MLNKTLKHGLCTETQHQKNPRLISKRAEKIRKQAFDKPLAATFAAPPETWRPRICRIPRKMSDGLQPTKQWPPTY